MLDLPGVAGQGTWGQRDAEEERFCPAALSGKGREYKLGRLKLRTAGRESERSVIPVKQGKTTR